MLVKKQIAKYRVRWWLVGWYAGKETDSKIQSKLVTGTLVRESQARYK